MFTDSDIAQFQAVNSPEEALEELEKAKQEKVFVKLMQDVKNILRSNLLTSYSTPS